MVRFHHVRQHPRRTATGATVVGAHTRNRTHGDLPTDTYDVRYIHRISPRDTDVKTDVHIAPGAFSDRKKLGAALRSAGILGKGESISSFRAEGDKLIVFPKYGIWWSIIITPH